MKKLFSILFLAAFTFAVSAQSTSPRFGTTPSKDNTGRVLTYKVITTADAAGLDTIAINANAFHTYIRPSANLTDSVCYAFGVTNAYLGDAITITVSKGSNAGAVRFSGSYFILSTSAARFAIPANKSGVIEFVFNGTKWIETNRVIQP